MLFRQISSGAIPNNHYKFGIAGDDRTRQYTRTICGVNHGYRPGDIDNTRWYYQTFRLELLC